VRKIAGQTHERKIDITTPPHVDGRYKSGPQQVGRAEVKKESATIGSVGCYE
jgi:hypothetical protein